MKKPKCIQRYERTYVRLFELEKNVRMATDLMNAGYSINAIARVLKCDRTSIRAFRKRQEKNGFVFLRKLGEKGLRLKRKKVIVSKVKKALIQPLYEEEKINQGKSYAEYLEDYKKECDRYRKQKQSLEQT